MSLVSQHMLVAARCNLSLHVGWFRLALLPAVDMVRLGHDSAQLGTVKSGSGNENQGGTVCRGTAKSDNGKVP